MLTGIILAGNSEPVSGGRMAALLPYQGELLIQAQVREMKKVCDEVMVVTPDPRPFLRVLEPSTRIIADYHQGKGSLGGFHAGFSLSSHPNIWAVGSDMPFLSAAAAMLLLECKQMGYEAAVPTIAGSSYPLHGVYDKACVRKIGKLIELGETRVQALLPRIQRMDVLEARFEEKGIELDFVKDVHTWTAAPELSSPVVTAADGGGANI
ncbi:molybdenum cofactor guanylyltransferase [Paenibacillus tuaregi]|uniref:molybdenum cofactor guanylyltransferase n=1 Tax=Paenibacillus tuaregi TaxID=1816681 RepID=UPI00083962ED|nr:NTP transferase domain-containing protein [Paenibacillus tuaregi]